MVNHSVTEGYYMMQMSPRIHNWLESRGPWWVDQIIQSRKCITLAHILVRANVFFFHRYNFRIFIFFDTSLQVWRHVYYLITRNIASSKQKSIGIFLTCPWQSFIMRYTWNVVWNMFLNYIYVFRDNLFT